MSQPSAKPAFARMNDADVPLYFWIEPWCDEFEVAPGARVEVFLRGTPAGPLEIEEAADQITIWAPSGALIDVAIDGSLCEFGCSKITVPEMGVLSTKGFVDVAFGDFPDARPAGIPRPRREGGPRERLRRLFSR